MSEKQHQYKMIALDMDGTMLNPQDEVSEANKQAIQRAQEEGVHVILSTGRGIRTCKPYADDLGLQSYLVTVNGSEIWTADGELLERVLIEDELIKKMKRLADKYETHYWAVSTEHVFRGNFPADMEKYDWLKFGFDTPDDDKREAIVKALSDKNELELSNSSETNIEVNAVGINKAEAVQKLCDRIGINMDQVIAMGDSLNDIKMIQAVGCGVAMGNAQDAVKEVANYQTDTNEADGVAKAIHYLLGWS
ncbi:Cof-type HAD-IIB family hydrolase [Terribacillus sp. DMT04]|uniref:Cof-type HAD-IIB family hydrolase n=1 Tax=Terribacillus sp. DMT04 TaxID=2850441 RepID=UPI001C2C71F9|nr:Cof-type HAD-IIB family hydrolase [Terribacillus sp. DMT04]QXE01010.1 Cof-type HAD-IIB family hydrolase [Terribacillus sp. DMT04]